MKVKHGEIRIASTGPESWTSYSHVSDSASDWAMSGDFLISVIETGEVTLSFIRFSLIDLIIVAFCVFAKRNYRVLVRVCVCVCIRVFVFLTDF